MPDGSHPTRGLTIVPLGGLGEIGRNMMAIQSGDDIVVIDCGLMFPEQEMLGIDLVIPDTTWLVQRASSVRAILLTHGHEDHIGALPYVLKTLPVPVYGTALTMGMVRHKLKEHGLLNTSELVTVSAGDFVSVGKIRAEFIHTTHSIPDACAIALHTPDGVVLHTGDFKMDSTPVHGLPPDLQRFGELGKAGVDLLLSDSTNADVDGTTPSERSVGPALLRLFGEAPGRILLATFASNISRLSQALEAAAAHHRKTVLVGRSMVKNVKVAHDLGILDYAPDAIIQPKEMDRYGDHEIAVLCTGSQGEPLSALTRIAAGEHPMVDVREGDTIILSANTIPGNEELVHRTINNLYRRKATVIRSSRQGVHASGHASREELKVLLALVKPRCFIPVHGEYRHLAAHAELAREVGVPAKGVAAIDNGTIVRVADGAIHMTNERAPYGYVYVDGVSISEDGDVVLRDRQHVATDGLVIVVFCLERTTGEMVAGPDVVARGMPQEIGNEMSAFVRDEVTRSLQSGSGKYTRVVLQQTIHELVSRIVIRRFHRRPLVLPVVTEV